ncbi:acetyl-CoA carboxylase biotin carboxyl carrier protein subunit [Acidisphaera sp. L21]|uniref:acetyl-CoA carboxylase biotin carboxyl carrier protein n=1 Tax=Acidisphaera sp. L21 TaxID=1641851 RepID=UPI00131C3FEC|nr:acetyl-CoA carboxylase biotin carboxyl carrier protein subunit [Acidisphaera sp. L21]
MDRITIKALIDALEASDLAELEYSQDGATLRLVKAGCAIAAPAVALPPRPPALPDAPPPAAPPGEFCSPLYGVVHLRPSPNAPPFVQPGQAIRAGQSLCTVEAMKAFTELRAETDGVVQAILVESGQEVESGQPLFRIV